MRELQVILHEIATDGLPDMEALVGRVAFIFDGCIVSGWPQYYSEDPNAGYTGRWEANSDVGWPGTKFANVTHWVEFPEPLHRLEHP